MSMNLRTMVALANESITTVLCCPLKERTRQMHYTFKCQKELAATLVAGDLVVVDTQYGVMVMLVVEVHEDSELDPENGIEYMWLFAKVPSETLATLKAEEDSVVATLVARRRSATRTRMKTLLDSTDVPLLLEGRTV